MIFLIKFTFFEVWKSFIAERKTLELLSKRINERIAILLYMCEIGREKEEESDTIFIYLFLHF